MIGEIAINTPRHAVKLSIQTLLPTATAASDEAPRRPDISVSARPMPATAR